MNRKRNVLYLCLSPTDHQGLVFPDELEEFYYSPGDFFIEQDENGRLSHDYRFLALVGNDIREFDLIQTEYDEHSFFKVTTGEYGTLAFFPTWTSLRYTGNRQVYHNIRLRRLIALNAKRLEDICMTKDFYFIGYSPSVEYE